MYSVVLATVLLSGSAAPDFGGKGLGCHGCYGAVYGGCYGTCYGGWACSGCGGCYGGCYGGCSGCYGGCSGCWGCGGCYGGCSGCYGGCSGCYGGCCGGWSSCYGGWSSCYGGCGGCYGGWTHKHHGRMGIYTAPPVAYAAPAPMTYGGCAGVVAPSHSMAPSNGYSIAPSNGGHAVAPSNGYSIAPSNAQPSDSHVVNPAPALMGDSLPQPSNGDANNKVPATVVIKAASDVKISVNGKQTTRKKDEETFKTPDLQRGQTYAYDVVAEVSRDGKTYTASKRVTVRAGERSEVSFGDMSEVIAAAKAEAARVTVLLPDGAKLYVDGKEHGSGAAKQTFDTPKLTKGKTYYYTLKVEVKSANNAGAKTQRVNVEAGKDVTVDFRSMFVSTR